MQWDDKWEILRGGAAGDARSIFIFLHVSGSCWIWCEGMYCSAKNRWLVCSWLCSRCCPQERELILIPTLSFLFTFFLSPLLLHSGMQWAAAACLACLWVKVALQLARVTSLSPHRKAINHWTHSYGQFRALSWPQAGEPRRTHAVSGRTCKLHTERDRTHNLLTVTWQR